MPKQRTWDVFCRVVDNYGDAAVCWRLASQLALEHGAKVRLFIDDPDTLRKLQPQPAPVEILRTGTPFGQTAEVAVDAFDSGLPGGYAAALDARALWLKLEYLSAEPWVDEHHGLPSPHPTLAARRYFFFPGFTANTGGLLREAGLLERRDSFDPVRFWHALGIERRPGALAVSLFGYGNPALQALLEAWVEGSRPVLALLTDCPLAAQVREFMGTGLRRGKLQVHYLPFLPQAQYDELLWACDWNFVRGEDSFVRAQWAAKPFIWQAYPQPESAHHAKVDAFLARYGADAARPLWRAWNGMGGDLAEAWSTAQIREHALQAHARAWADRLAAQGELAGELADFAENLLK